jgi:glycosyltransferase involved in cell wall biosynthesis
MVAGPLTVVQMLPELESGGVERGTLELAKYLSRNGHRSIVISGGGRLVPQLESEGSEHVLWAIGRKSPLTLRFVPRLRRFLIRQNVDILHLRSRVPAWVGYLAWRSLPEQSRPHLVTTFHGFYSVSKYSAIMTKGERVIAISKTIQEHIQKVYNVPYEKITLIHRGVDTDIFNPSKVSQDRIRTLQSAWGVNVKQKPLIMLPGRVTSWKGHDIFLRSLSGIKDLSWTAVCVGELDRGSSYVKNLLMLRSKLGLEKRVRFVEYCDDMPAAYLLADIVVSASSTQAEAFGRISVEAQAMGRPVIATAHGGSIETVIDRKTGWLVQPNDTESMVEVLREALTDKTRMKQHGENGIKWVRDNFTVKRMCEKTVSLYSNFKEYKQ